MDTHSSSASQAGVLMPPVLTPSLLQPSSSLYRPSPSQLRTSPMPCRPSFLPSHQHLFGLSPPARPTSLPTGPTHSPPRSSPSPSRPSPVPSAPSPSPSPFPSSSPAPAVLVSHYEAPRSRPFTDDEFKCGAHKATREKSADRVIEHPLDAIVEYPETGNGRDITVAHIFNIRPDSFYHPRFNFQYSLGGEHGGRGEVTCKMLQDALGKPVKCSKLRTTCRSFVFLMCLRLGLMHFLTGRGLRYCSFRPYTALTHSFTSRQAMATLPHTATSHVASLSPTDDAHVEVFQKTLAFYCALIAKGCVFSSAVDFPDSSDTIEQENNPPLDADDESLKKRKVPNCYGSLELKYDSYNQPYIQYVFPPSLCRAACLQ